MHTGITNFHLLTWMKFALLRPIESQYRIRSIPRPSMTAIPMSTCYFKWFLLRRPFSLSFDNGNLMFQKHILQHIDWTLRFFLRVALFFVIHPLLLDALLCKSFQDNSLLLFCVYCSIVHLLFSQFPVVFFALVRLSWFAFFFLVCSLNTNELISGGSSSNFNGKKMRTRTIESRRKKTIQNYTKNVMYIGVSGERTNQN